jgi:hypothetical protein
MTMMAMGRKVRGPLREKQAGSGSGASVLQLQQFSLFLSVRAHLKHSLLALQQQRLFAAVAFLLPLLLRPQGPSLLSSCRLESVRRWPQQEALARSAAAILS